MQLSVIAAIAKNNVIGKDNRLIWHLPADLKHFKKVTMGAPIIMGRKTYESIGRALPGRTSVVITRQKNYSAPSCIVVDSLDKAMQLLKEEAQVFVIGGAEIYKQALPKADKLFITKIDASFEGDTFFPEIDYDAWTLVEKQERLPDEKNKFHCTFLTYTKK